MASGPAPVRGAVVRRLGELLREHLDDLATLVTVEVGKITSEARGEVQEMVDICDYAVGLSRQLFGRTMTSERPGHRLMETWHPLGVVGVISAFNFPVAVWSWNTAIALVCGDAVVWKPSEQAPLCALASGALLSRALTEAGFSPTCRRSCSATPRSGSALVDDPAVALLSATGSTRMGREVGPARRRPVRAVAARARRQQRRDRLPVGRPRPHHPRRRLLGGGHGRPAVHVDAPGDRARLGRRRGRRPGRGGVREAADRLAVRAATLVGPLVNERAHASYAAAVSAAVDAGGTLVTGGSRVLATDAPDAFYVQPTVVRMPAQSEVVHTETFAPLLYVMTYDDLDEAVALNNAVPQGLSSSIFTQDQAEAELFMSAAGSDCGIVNVNIGTSGAEIGGAFGGEKETGGGRESGSDAWRAYMRRATNTINYSGDLPLAQGVTFDVEDELWYAADSRR